MLLNPWNTWQIVGMTPRHLQAKYPRSDSEYVKFVHNKLAPWLAVCRLFSKLLILPQ